MLRIMMLLLAMTCMTPVLAAQPVSQGDADAAMIKQFEQSDEVAPERAISTKRKHEILFLMGAGLLILLLLTAALGLAMGIWEKDVFTWHMLSAGLTLTLAIVHAVVSFVWFYPD